MVDIVDENDKAIKVVPWTEMHKNALLHRASNVILFNSKGEIFVHKRQKNLLLYPSMWDVKIGGTARAGENYEECAKRELMEEAGIKDAKLEYLFSLKLRTKENNNNKKVYKCTYNGKIKLNKKEIESGRFMSINDAEKLYNKGKVSPSGTQVFEKYLKLKC